jgi:hypothetical protein
VAAKGRPIRQNKPIDSRKGNLDFIAVEYVRQIPGIKNRNPGFVLHIL